MRYRRTMPILLAALSATPAPAQPLEPYDPFSRTVVQPDPAPSLTRDAGQRLNPSFGTRLGGDATHSLIKPSGGTAQPPATGQPQPGNAVTRPQP
jgi:hypothetical protein